MNETRLSSIDRILFLMGNTLARAADPPVTAIAFAPDGKQVVVGSQQGLIVKKWSGLETERRLDYDSRYRFPGS